MNDLIESIRSNPDVAALALLIVLLAPDVRLFLSRFELPVLAYAAQAVEAPADPGAR